MVRQRDEHLREGYTLTADEGTKVYAVEGGRVVKRRRESPLGGGVGNVIAVRSSSGNLWTYRHLRAPAGVKRGTIVQAGDELGEVGDTGLGVSRPMLRIRLERQGERVDPRPILKAFYRS